MIITISNYPDRVARADCEQELILRVFTTNKLINHFLGGLYKHRTACFSTKM